LRVQNAQPRPVPTPPRAVVWMRVRIMPIVLYICEGVNGEDGRW
jgi:hypothetical protein